MEIQWLLKKFDLLTPHELYAILQLRSEVFVVEQNCIFLDMDDKDQNSHHFMGFCKNKLIAYTRLVPPGEVYEQASIGRVVTSPSVRNSGSGKAEGIKSEPIRKEITSAPKREAHRQ